MKSKFLRQAPRRFREILRLNDFGENRQRIQISLFHSILRLKRIRPNYPNYGNIISMSSALPRPSNKSVAVVKGSPAKETMSTKTKFVLYVATVLGMASAALAMPQHPTHREAGSTVQRQVASSASGSEGFASAPDQSPRMTATYFDPSPAPFKAYTYSASVRLNPSTSKRIWHGELSFPAFSATPTVSVQIVSSISAVPMQVKSLKMVENPGPSGPVETQMTVEAEPIFDGTASGVYFANLVVTGVPVAPPTKSDGTQLLH